MTLEELNQLNDLKREIVIEKGRLEALRTRVYGSTGRLSGAPGGGSNESRIARYYPLIESLEAVIEDKICQAICKAEALERYITEIPDSFMRQIFTLRFIDGLEWRDVAQRMGGGNSWKNISNMCYRYLQKENN